MDSRGGALGRVAVAALVAAHLASCATRPADIHPRYVSPLIFAQASCAQLAGESSTVSSRMNPLSRQLNRNATIDAIWVGTYVPLVVLVPFTFFLLNGNGAQYEEYSGLLGQREAIQEQIRQKRC